MRIVVLGLGNPILSDDAAGLHAVRGLAQRLEADPRWRLTRGSQASPDAAHMSATYSLDSTHTVTVIEASVAGFAVMEMLSGHDHAILVDTMLPPQGSAPGELARLDTESISSTVRLASVHDINLATALEFGRKVGLSMPAETEVYVITAERLTDFGEECSPEVQAAAARATMVVFDRVTELCS